MDKEELTKAVLESAKGSEEPEDRKKLSCAEAFELAREFGAEIIEVGRICNQYNVRICKCQLGCFG